MNARELLTALGGLPGVRQVRAGENGVAASVRVSRIEVALARAAGEAALRRTWRRRTGGGPDPLLLLAEHPEDPGAVLALGPLNADGPVRTVDAESLLATLRRLAGLAPLQAVRELAEELDRLDRATVAGLVVRGLGTEHFFRTRLRDSPHWERLSELAQGATGEWREALQGLGYGLEALRPRGYVARHADRPAAVVWPMASPAEFARLDADGRPPEGVLLQECRRQNARYGLLVAGSRLRLFEALPESGSAAGRYLELDASLLAEADRPLLGLLAPSFLAEGALEALLRDARSFGVQVRKRLDQAIRQDVLPRLGLALGRAARARGVNLGDDRLRSELEAVALTFVFRALFLLYAESAGHLPVGHEPYRRHSFRQIVEDARDQAGALGGSTTLYGRIQVLVKALRTGNPGLGVPAYNGALFSEAGLEGAEILERLELTDAELGPALVALGVDPESGLGFDFSGLEIGHLGHIYEGLLSLRLSVADRDYRYDAPADRYVPAEGGEVEVPAGDLLWLSDEGGRKGGGVYYTPELLVRHLVRRGVLPAFERHLEGVAELVETDPQAAARRLFAFRVLDPACGSAHFLVAVVDELADRISRFLGEHPLPAVRSELEDLRAGAGATYGVGIEDAQLLRRLVLRRCVYGVDVSPMGAEIAKISLWLASFVPGLSLAYLDHNVRVGNSLIGVASAEQLLDASGATTIPAMLVGDAVKAAAEAAAPLFDLMDRTPDEVARSAEVDRAVQGKVEDARALLDLWIAEPLGLERAREHVWSAAEEIAAGRRPLVAAQAQALAREHRAFHWPLEFPEAFASGRGGFDAVVGNPPWEEVTVEELAFYARYQPGLRALPERERDAALARLKEARPELTAAYEAELAETAALRAFFAADTGYEGSPGDPDLYKFFCERYRKLLADRAVLAVVLPRSAFSGKGSTGFRRWLFDATTVLRLDFLLNNRLWMFETHPQYTVALLISEADRAPDEHRFEVAGVAASEREFASQSASDGVKLSPAALNDFLTVPLLPSQAAADLLARRFRSGRLFPYGCGRWRCFPVAEFHETHDKGLWRNATEGRELWKGESFDQYDPHGAEARPCPASPAALKRQRKSRPGQESLLAGELSSAERLAAVASELAGPRLAFRDVSRSTDSRTVRAALVPPDVFLTNTAPYLVFAEASDLDRACCLGLVNSLPFDWQARRYVETHVNFFILEGLRLPDLTDGQHEVIARAAARLSCPDERFARFAASTGVEWGPLEPKERERLRAEIDAQVAHAWQLGLDELEVVLSDFTLDAVPEPYRERVRARLRELRTQ